MKKHLGSSEGSSGRTFDLKAIAAGSNGAQVTNSERACRITVTISAARNLRRRNSSKLVKDPVFKVTVEGKSMKSSEIKERGDEHDVLNIDQSFTFDVKDVKNSVLSVQVYGKGLFGMELLGQCRDFAVAELLQACQADLCSEWYELYSRDGKRTFPGKVLMQIVAGIAKPEQKIHVFVGTWNVGNSRPGSNLSSWLPTTPSYDIVTIGAQECDYPAGGPYTDSSKDWMATLKSVLGSRYKVVRGFSRGQMRLVVFVRDDAEKAISEVHSGSEATGVGHVMANKGGLCITLKFWDTSMCFVNCHFAAHVGQCEARNGNYREIVGNMRVGLQNMDILNQFHHVFWMGDLNYRLDFEDKQLNPQTTHWSQVVEQIEQDNFLSLLQFDELHKEQEAGRVLHLFKEGEIKFPPTFKMKRDLEEEYDQKRMPAWCDRILWSSLPGCNVELLSYNSVRSISTSDHKPVAATFTLTAHALPCNSSDSVDEDDKRWHARFTSLRAKNLRASDMSGYSDPYVSFVGPSVFQEVHTKVKFQTLNPVWNPLKDLPTIVLNTFAIQRLEKEYLMVRVVDYDYTSTDDTLGYGVIPLAAAVSAFKSKGTAKFNVELSHRGCPAGTLEGVMKLTWERNVTKRRYKLASGFMDRTLSIQQQLKKSILSNRMS